MKKTPEEQQVEGMVDKGKGRVKEAVGALTGDNKTRAEGQADQAKGSIKKGVGDLRETIKKNI